VLIHQSPDEYTIPSLPFDIQASTTWQEEEESKQNQPVEFGLSARKLFNINFKDWTFINHGAFGSPLLSALQISHQWNLYSVCIYIYIKPLFHH